jgi:alpha-tubulin suppressor-like RCC1 family protein
LHEADATKNESGGIVYSYPLLEVHQTSLYNPIHALNLDWSGGSTSSLGTGKAGRGCAGEMKPPLPKQAASVLVESIITGRKNSYGLKSDSCLACWGDDSLGQTTQPSSTFAQFSAGTFHNSSLKSDGTLAYWRDNSFYQFNFLTSTFTQIVLGTVHYYGLRSDGIPACWKKW